MDAISQLTNAVPAVIVGIVLAFYLRGRFEEQKNETNRRFEEQKADTNRRFDDVQRQIDRLAGEVAAVRSDITAVRSDLTNVALAVGARLRPEAGTG